MCDFQIKYQYTTGHETRYYILLPQRKRPDLLIIILAHTCMPQEGLACTPVFHENVFISSETSLRSCDAPLEHVVKEGLNESKQRQRPGHLIKHGCLSQV